MIPSRAPGARWPAKISCSTSVAARSLKVPASLAGWLGLRSGAGMTKASIQDQFRGVELRLQHFLRRHDVDPPRQLLGLQYRFGLVRRRRLDQFKRLPGEL